MECLSAEEHLIHGFCHQSVWEEAQQGYQCDENVMDSTGCGLSEDDVFSLGLLDPPQPGRGGEEGELMESLADPELSRSGAGPMLEQEQGSCNIGFAPESHQLDNRSSSCQMQQQPQHTSSLREQLRHFQYPPLTSEMCGQMSFFGSNPSVFVPVFYSQPLKVEEPAIVRSSPTPLLRKLDLESLTSTGSYEAATKSCGSLASADSACIGEACVPDLSPRSHAPSPKAEACVPDYFLPGAAAMGARQLRRRSGSGAALAQQAEEPGWACHSSDTDNAAPAPRARHPGGGGDASLHAPPMGCDGSVKYSRSDCLQRYRDKKLRRHFTHKVRYTARKLNADRRPRVKGRFVKASEMLCPDMEGSNDARAVSVSVGFATGKPSQDTSHSTTS